MDFQKIITAFFVKSKQFTSEEVAELLEKTDATEDSILKFLLDKDKERVKTLQTEHFNNGHKKAKGEALADFEKSLREKFEIDDSSLTGLDLVQRIIEIQDATQKQQGGTLTDDDVKKHPLYVKAVDEHKKALKAANDDWKAKYTKLESDHNRAGVISGIVKKGKTILDGLNPILPESAEIAARQLEWFNRELTEGVDFEDQDGRTVILKGGKIVEDGHGNPVEFEEYAKGVASKLFTFKKTDVGGNAGNERTPGGAGAKTTFQNEQAYFDYMTNDSVPDADKVAAAEAWEKAKAGA